MINIIRADKDFTTGARNNNTKVLISDIEKFDDLYRRRKKISICMIGI